MGAASDEVDERAADEDIARTLNLAQAGWGIEDIAVDVDRDEVWVIEALYAHRDCFRPEHHN